MAIFLVKSSATRAPDNSPFAGLASVQCSRATPKKVAILRVPTFLLISSTASCEEDRDELVAWKKEHKEEMQTRGTK